MDYASSKYAFSNNGVNSDGKFKNFQIFFYNLVSRETFTNNAILIPPFRIQQYVQEQS